MPTSAETYRRILDRDPALLDALHRADPAAHAAVARLLRVTRLEMLRRRADCLVEVVAACPELHGALRHAWGAQDPRFTAQFLGWVGRRTLRAAA